MPKEDHSSTRSHQSLSRGGGVELSLDELSKGLASGDVSRRRALRLLGGALVGGALASLPGVAWAQGGGNSACVRCCKRAFEPGEKITVRGRERSARGYCISQSAKNRECYVPCEDNGNGDCPYGEELCGGECVLKCPEGQVRDFSTCVCGGGEPICDPPCPPALQCVEAGPGETVCYPRCDPPCEIGTFCFANQDSTASFCVCGQGGCTDDCSFCESIGLTCALADPIAGCAGRRFQCVTPGGAGEC